MELPNGKTKALKLLEAPDAIMEPQVFSFVSDFLKAGGTPQEVIKCLSESYHGYAQYLNMISKWSVKLGFSEVWIERLEKKVKELVISLFDPKKADSIFTLSEGRPPVWIESLVKIKQWRDVIYELSERHRNCLFLNFAIQKISDAGFHNEITGVSSASSHLNVYCRVIQELVISSVNCATSNGVYSDSFKKLSKSLVSTALQQEHTFLFTVSLLFSLHRNQRKSENGLEIFKILLQEIMSQVGKGDRAEISYKLYLLFFGESRKKGPLSNSSSAISSNDINDGLDAIQNIIVQGYTTSGDIISIHHVLRVIPIELLQHKLFFDILLSDIFCSERAIPSQHKEKYLYILSFASISRESEMINEVRLNETVEALSWLEEKLKSAGPVDIPSILKPLLEKMKYPIVSMAVLAWLKFVAEDTSVFERHLLTGSTPIHYVLLEEIALNHVGQRECVFEFLTELFEKNFGNLSALVQVELKRLIINRFVFLMECDYVNPVFLYFSSHASEMDESLIVYFLTLVYARFELDENEPILEKLKERLSEQSLRRLQENQI